MSKYNNNKYINDLFCTLLFQCAQFRAPEPKSG